MFWFKRKPRFKVGDVLVNEGYCERWDRIKPENQIRIIEVGIKHYLFTSQQYTHSRKFLTIDSNYVLVDKDEVVVTKALVCID